MFQCLKQLDSPHIIPRLLRVQIADNLIRLAHICPHNGDQIAIDLPLAKQFHNRDIQALFIHLTRTSPQRATANIHCMTGIGKPSHAPAPIKNRRDNRNIVQMPRPQPRVIGEQTITRFQRVNRIRLHKMPHAIRHCIDMPRRPRHRLRQHIARAVKHPRRQIASLAHHRSKRSVHQCRRLLIHNRNEAIPQNF